MAAAAAAPAANAAPSAAPAPAPTVSPPAAPGAAAAGGRVRTREFVGAYWRRISLRVAGCAAVVYVGALWYGRAIFSRLTTDELSLVALAMGAFALLVLALVVFLIVIPHIATPTARLADVAEAVAGGDLSVTISGRARTGEIGRLWSAVGRMVIELRRLAGALRGSASETAALAHEITTGTEHMASAAQEMAATSHALSEQSSQMANTIQSMADDAGALVRIAADLAAGAQEGVVRNATLRELAEANSARVDESNSALDALDADVQASAVAVEALAAASEEIGAFVTYVQKMARQSKLLALNAAMEAARAGRHGQGFAVVAGEVRRLAANSADAATRTATLVAGVLARVSESRETTARTALAVAAVKASADTGSRSFAQVQSAVRDADVWTASIAEAAHTSNGLIADMTTRLDELARGTESFAAAMQEVAASGQQQSASTEEIAAAANALTQAAARLGTLVSTFRGGDGDDASMARAA